MSKYVVKKKNFKTIRGQKIEITIFSDGTYKVEQILKYERLPGRIFQSSFGNHLVFNRFTDKLYPFSEETSRKIEEFMRS